MYLRDLEFEGWVLPLSTPEPDPAGVSAAYLVDTRWPNGYLFIRQPGV